MDKDLLVGRASDAAMIVAAGKLMVFRSFWKEVLTLAKKKGYNEKKIAELRTHLQLAVDRIDDNIFFVRPGQDKTPQEVDAELKRRIKDAHIDEQVMKSLEKDLKGSQSDLNSFFS